MEIVIHQAICGEQSKAWDLLKTTFPDLAVAKKIAFKTDLQDSPPIGLKWKPVLRGFSFSDYYLIIKTFPDDSPDVRPGRVFSYCLILSISDLPRINDLSQVISFLPATIDKQTSVEPLSIAAVPNGQISVDEAFRKRFNKVIKGFARLTSYENTIIWIGQQDFEVAVRRFWQMLPTDQRQHLNFGINFNPSELSKERINLIVVPENIQTKFVNRGYCVVGTNDSAELTEFSEQFLGEDESAKARLARFATAIESVQLTLKDIVIVSKGIATFEKLQETTDLKLLNTLAHIVAKYSPDPNRGVELKTDLLRRICTLSESSSAADFILLKNFPISNFKKANVEIPKSLAKWLKNILLGEEFSGDRSDHARFVEQIYDGTDNWLTTAIRGYIDEFLSKLNKASCRILWGWIESEENLLGKLDNVIENSPSAQELFVDTMVSNAQVVLNNIMAFARSRDWFNLHAHCLSKLHSPEVALIRQLEIDRDFNYYKGIETILSGLSGEKILSLALSHLDPRLIKLSATICCTDPRLLKAFDVESDTWQSILFEVLSKDLAFFDKLENGEDVAYSIYDALIAGKNIDIGLLHEISFTRYANILNYANRVDLWKSLGDETKSILLEKTASALLSGLSADPNFKVPIDTELSSYIISHGISTFLYFNRSNLKSVLPIFSTYQQLSEQYVSDYVTNYRGQIDVVDATQLGRLVFQRHYRRVAHAIYQKAFDYESFKIALGECYKLLNIIAQGIAWFRGAIASIDVSEDEWWDAFVELSYKLYPAGPTENKIWKEADGEEYELQLNTSGKQAWIFALQQLRVGGCEGITVRKLLKAMMSDFHKNEDLKILYNLWKGL